MTLRQTTYGEQMRLLADMCDNQGLAEATSHVAMRFHVEPGLKMIKLPGQRRRKTLLLKERVESAAEALGLAYTLFQDPDSTYWDPVFVCVITAKTWLLLEFYRTLADD